MRRVWRTAAAALALGALLPAAAFAAGQKTGGGFVIVDDLVGGSAGGVGLGGPCAGLCLAGSVGQVATGGSSDGTHTVGAGYFDFHYDFRRLHVLLPGEGLDPGQPTGKVGAPLPRLVDQPFTVRVFATDDAFNVASTAAASVILSTTGANLPQTQALIDGSTAFTVVFGSTGTDRRLEARLPGGALATLSQAFGVFAPTSSSPSLSINIPPNSVRSTLNGAIAGFVSDGVAVSQVLVAFQRKNPGSSSGPYWDWVASSFSAASPVYGAAALSNAGTPSSPWSIAMQDSALTNHTSYFIVAIASNTSGAVTVAQTTFTFNNATLVAGSPGDGQGSISLQTDDLYGCKVIISSLVFTAGPAGIFPGGFIALRIPDGWTRPVGLSSELAPPPGFLNVGSTTPVTVEFNPPSKASATLGDNWIVVNPAGQAISAGQRVWLRYAAFPASGPGALAPQHFPVQTRGGPGGNLKPIAVSTSVTLGAGAPARIDFDPRDALALGPLQTSSTMQLVLTDQCGNSTSTALGNITASLSVRDFGGNSDNGALFDQEGGGLIPSRQATFLQGAGVAGPRFYVRTAFTGIDAVLLTATATIPGLGEVWASRYARLHTNPVAITDVSVDTGTLIPGALIATVTGNSFQSPAFINFKVSDPSVRWEVSIASDATFSPVLAQRFGAGNPGRSVTWSGLLEREHPQRFLPPGLYHVRIRAEGGVAENAAPRIRLGESASIFGTVKSTGAGAHVQAYGPGTNFGHFAVASSTGYFQIYGLQAGRAYNVTASTGALIGGLFTRLQVSSHNVVAQNGGANVGEIPFPTVSFLRVAASIPHPAAREAWGSVFAFNENYTRTGHGALHFFKDAASSDDGGQVFGRDGSTWTVVGLLPGTYTVDATVWDVGVSTRIEGVVIEPGMVTDLPIVFTRRANLSGWTIVPSPTAFGAWVSVQAQRQGERRPRIFGGSFIPGVQEQPVGVTSNTFTLYGLDPGTWTVTARAHGFSSASNSVFISSNADVSDFNLPLGTGGVLIGTVTIAGDTTKFGDAAGGGFSVFVNLWNPTGFSHHGFELRFATSATLASSTFSVRGLDDGSYHLNIFREGLSGAHQTVVVSGGAGNAGIVPLSVNSARAFLTVRLPGGPHPPEEFRKVALYLRTENQGSKLVQDMVAGSTVAYHPSSATWQSPPFGGGHFEVEALYAPTGAYGQAWSFLSNNTTAFLTIDLTAATTTISGKLEVTGAIALSSASFAVTVSSVPGLFAHAGSVEFCLMGARALSTSAVHVQLIPVRPWSRDGPFGGSLVRRSQVANCDETSPPDNTGWRFNPFHAYIASVSADGSFSFAVPRGAYILRNHADLDGNPATGQELPQLNQLVDAGGGAVQGLSLRLDAGSRISGRLLAPPGVPLSRPFAVTLLDSSARPIRAVTAVFDGSQEAAYSFDKVPDGGYAIRADDRGFPRNFGARPINVKVQGADLSGQDIRLGQTGLIKGRLAIQQELPGGTTRQFTLISRQNVHQLGHFNVNAVANPWFQGGYFEARGEFCGPDGCRTPSLDEADQFVIEGVLPGKYDLEFRSHISASAVERGATPLLNAVRPGIEVSQGRTTDIGTLTTVGAVQLRGRVTEAATGLPLANILMRARATVEQTSRSHEPQATTGSDGTFVLHGFDPRVRFYDVYAADRDHSGSSSPAPFEQRVARSVDLSTVTTLNFSLTPAPFSVRGRVVPPPGGPPLRSPFGRDQIVPLPGAVVFLQKTTEFPTKNPVADIEVETEPDGRFEIPSLTAGIYRMIVTALEYSSLQRTVIISTASLDVGDLVLGRGATLSGSIRKPDGSSPSFDEVDFMVAATPDLGELLFARMEKDQNNRTVTGYSIAGFRPGVVYRLLMGGEKTGGIIGPEEGRRIVFSTTTESRTLDVVLRPARPFAFAKARRQANGSFQIQFETSQPLRNKTTADNNLELILTTFSARGALSEFELDAGRSRLTALYTPGVGDSSFTLRLSAFTTVTDPESLDPVNPEFLLVSTVTFFTGIDGLHRTNISNVNGGNLIVEGDSGGIRIPSGAFDVDASSTVEVTLQLSNENLANRALSGLQGSAANIAALRYQGSYYPSGILRAIAATPPDIPPFSGFYNVLLPLGVRTALSRPVQMCLTYPEGADPNTLNLYWYNEAANAFILQQDSLGQAPVIDAEKRTKCVNVNHFSTFVLFNTGVAVITGEGFTGGEIEAFNFPNPFDLSVKTVTPIHGVPAQTVRGTMIRIAVPASVSGDASIRIFNVAGERVRTISLGTLQGGSYLYQGWDGRNDSGRDVASGVYIAQVKVGGRSKFFKMALIK